jgi:TetR/AcrR family fatty acid metabolism transcriptional regulator
LKENRLTKRKQQAIETKQKITDAALALIRRKGFDNVTVEEITQRAGFSKALFYKYFSSKDQIIVDQFITVDDYYREVAKNGLMGLRGVIKILRFARLQAMYCNKIVGLDLIRHVLQSTLTHHERGRYLNDPGRSIYALVAEMVREAQEDGEVRKDLDIREVAWDAVHIMRGFNYLWCVAGGGFDPEERIEHILSNYLRGLHPKVAGTT